MEKDPAQITDSYYLMATSLLLMIIIGSKYWGF